MTPEEYAYLAILRCPHREYFKDWYENKLREAIESVVKEAVAEERERARKAEAEANP